MLLNRSKSSFQYQYQGPFIVKSDKILYILGRTFIVLRTNCKLPMSNLNLKKKPGSRSF